MTISFVFLNKIWIRKIVYSSVCIWFENRTSRWLLFSRYKSKKQLTSYWRLFSRYFSWLNKLQDYFDNLNPKLILLKLNSVEGGFPKINDFSFTSVWNRNINGKHLRELVTDIVWILNQWLRCPFSDGLSEIMSVRIWS